MPIIVDKSNAQMSLIYIKHNFENFAICSNLSTGDKLIGPYVIGNFSRRKSANKLLGK